MPSEPQIQTLSYASRARFFWLLFAVFVISLPMLIFYTTGFRFAYIEAEPTIVSTGGVYVSADDRNVDVYINEILVDDRRLFQQAFYIQNIDVGVHRLVVQREGLNTWVKNIPIFPYLVTEAASFNVPVVPYVRYITPYRTSTGVVVITSTSSVVSYATTTEPFALATSTATTSLVQNEEFDFIDALFSATTTTERRSVLTRVQEEIDRFAFRSEISTTTAAAIAATTSVQVGDMLLHERGGEIYAKWVGGMDRVPYYFCVQHTSASSTAEMYGAHVAADIAAMEQERGEELSGRVCRDEIRIDRKWQDVYYFDFVPGRSDLVLMHLEDGLYVVEIDDRSWQNTQRLYESRELRLVVENGQIFVKEDDLYFELFTVDEPT